ncbi:MAG TPA: hypothetical protein VFO27_16350 [Bryobacteraceae bacterium]|nr:hypothetical protein [Bryobacteraceae bacterium]
MGPRSNSYTHVCLIREGLKREFPKCTAPTDAEYIAELEASLAAEQQTWTDGEGVVWTRPTAWAYAQACAVVKGRQLTAEKERDAIREKYLHLIGAVQRFQPGGSPPPGGPEVLVPWILRSLDEQREAALARAREAEEKAVRIGWDLDTAHAEVVRMSGYLAKKLDRLKKVLGAPAVFRLEERKTVDGSRMQWVTSGAGCFDEKSSQAEIELWTRLFRLREELDRA